MYAIIEEHKMRYCYFTLKKVTEVHFEGGSQYVFMNIYNYLNFLYFETWEKYLRLITET